MRLLMTTDTVGGVWTFTSELTTQLLRRGHAVHLVSFGRQPSSSQAALTGHLTQTFPHLFHFTASDIPLEWMQNNEQAHAQGAVLLHRLLSREAFHLVVSNQFCFGQLDTTLPRIVVAHSDVLSWASACRPTGLEASPWLERYTALVQAGLREASAVITPTDWMGKALLPNFFLPHRYLVIPNGVCVSPMAGPARQRRLQAITAGRLWDEAKGLETLRTLKPSLPILVAGNNRLHDADAGQSWPEHLTDLGPLSQPQLHQHFRESALYLCTSLYEPFGLAPLEAALCGCAVVARDLPSLREVWGDGALYFSGTASLQATLASLAHSPDALAEAQRSAHFRATQFTAERMTENYLHLFHSVLQQAQVSQHVA